MYEILMFNNTLTYLMYDLKISINQYRNVFSLNAINASKIPTI